MSLARLPGKIHRSLHPTVIMPTRANNKTKKTFEPVSKPKVNCHHGPTNTFIIASPIGELALECCPRGLHQLTAHDTPTDDYFHPDPSVNVCIKEQLYDDNGYTYKPTIACTSWLKQYFEGHVPSIVLPPICHFSQPNGKFTQKVWQTLKEKVELGTMVSYKQLADMCGNSKACQAVGQAMRNNPIMIIVPCHRVILSSGSLGNYSGGRRNSVKQWLLQHEGATKG